MRNLSAVRQSWEYGTYEGAEEARKEAWRQLSWREKLRWLEEAHRFIAKLKSGRSSLKKQK